MAEPNVANRNASIGSKKQAPSTIQDKKTNDSTISRQGGSGDSNSLMREISIRNKQSDVNQSQPVPVPQLKQINKPKERSLAKD